MQSNLRSSDSYAGFSWYLGDDHERPEAASFADAIGEVENFVLALERPFVLGGDGQGGVLSTTLALFAPPRLLAVIARRGAIANVDGWDMPLESLAGIDFVIDDVTVHARDRSASILEQRDARVVGVADLAGGVTAWLRGFAEHPNG
ncbi:MAG TPA: hypothetical protein VGK20_01740 [Candidatus Binatia bacterium]|jgi:hypothetical protein